MERKLIGLGTLVLVLIIVLTAACAGPSTAAPSDGKQASSTQARAKANDTMRFDPATVTVKSGIPVRLTLTDEGALEHTWVVDNLNGKKVEADAKPKASSSVEFTPTTAGTYGSTARYLATGRPYARHAGGPVAPLALGVTL